MSVVRRILEISGPPERVEQQLLHSLRDGQHVIGDTGLALKLKTVYSEVATIAEANPFDRNFHTNYVEPPLDLYREDVYDEGVIPNEDVMTALKVLRTIKQVCSDRQQVWEETELATAIVTLTALLTRELATKRSAAAE